MRPEITDFNSVRRFQQEAKVMSAFRLMHLPVVLDFGLSRCGRPYMVMELVEGTSLKEVIAEKGTLSVGLVIDITMQILTALKHAHERGIVHRDLKSHNVMVSWLEDGRPMAKVVDFGLALGINRPGHITESGVALGTPYYMSPEQAQGRITDARSDIYSLGCVLFEMLTGQTPFQKASMAETLDAHIRVIAPSLGSRTHIDNDMLSDLECVVAKCLEKDPGKRYQNADELIAVLDELNDKMRRDEALRLRRLFHAASVAGMRSHSTSMTNLKAIQTPTNDLEFSPSVANDNSVEFSSWKSGSARVNQKAKHNAAHHGETRRSAHGVGMSTILLVMTVALLCAMSLMLLDKDFLGMFQQEQLPVEIDDMPVLGYLPQAANPEMMVRADYFGKEMSTVSRNFHVTGQEFFALPQTSDADLKDIRKHSEVRFVNLMTSQCVTGGGLNEIKDLPLERLDLRSLTINQTGFDAIAEMSGLKTLRIDYMQFLTSQKLAKVKQIKNLMRLSGRGVHLTKQSQIEIAQMTNLEILILDNATGLSDSSLEMFAKMPNLKHLSVSNCSGLTRNGALKFIAARPQLVFEY